jgi:glycosyltransferase involved in cell wall biosynthesis
MATAPALSVIMSVYNGARYLDEAVESILAQDFADFEFLIINDGSTDGSGTMLQKMAASDRRIRLIDRENRGLVASLNEMIALSKAPLLARMDCDDIAMPNRFSLQIAYMNANPEIGILGTNTHDLTEDGRTVAAEVSYPLTPGEVKAWLQKGPPLCHPSVMMRTDLVGKLGGYRPAFRHAEDYDLWLRASRLTAIANLPEPLLLYRRSENQISQKYAIEQAKAAAIAWFDHLHCLGGGQSPFDTITTLPSLERLDDVFGSNDIGAAARKRIVERLRYSAEFLSGPEFGLMIDQVKTGKGFVGASRTILRLGRIGKLQRAIALAMAMTGLLLSDS